MAAALQTASRRLTAEQRRHQLVRRGARAVRAAGYRATTMDDIAEAAGVTKPLLYQHFSSKRALVSRAGRLHRPGPAHRHRAGRRCSRRPTPAGRARLRRATSGWSSATRPSSASSTGATTPTTRNSGRALRAVEDAIAEAIDPLIDAGLEPDHRRLLAYGIVGMAEGASRRFMEQRLRTPGRRDGRRGGPEAGAAHGRPGLGGPALGPRRLSSRTLTRA